MYKKTNNKTKLEFNLVIYLLDCKRKELRSLQLLNVPFNQNQIHYNNY